MAEMSKINADALENVAGGATRTVANDAVNYANVREKPGLNTKVMFKIPKQKRIPRLKRIPSPIRVPKLNKVRGMIRVPELNRIRSRKRSPRL